MRRRPLTVRRPLAALALAASLVVALAAGGAAQAAPSAGPEDLKADIDKILSDARLATAQAGVVVTSGKTGEVLYSRNDKSVLLPASNTKMLTSAAAFEVLGADHKFSTSVLSKGSGPVLRGDLYLKGTGDPTMLAADYDDLAAKTAASGIKVVRGKLVAEDTWFDEQRLGAFWAWDDEPYYYSAPISALTASPDTDFDAGAVIVSVSPGASTGAPAKVTITPDSGTVKIVNRATTGGSGSSITVDREHGANTMVITGTIPAGADPVQEYMSVWDPTTHSAGLFRRALRKHGVRVLGPTTRGAAPDGTETVTKRESKPLSDVSVPFMKLSNNMIAEILIKSMGRKSEGKGTWSAGVAAVSKFLNANGVTGLRMTDGSGLSRADLVSPGSFVKLLAAVRSKPWFNAWLNSLPVAGNPDRMIGGTLRNRMRDTAAANNVRAKTGTLTSVTALSGYVTSKDDEQLLFSIMLNNHLSGSLKDVEDKIAIRLAEFSRTKSGDPEKVRLRTPERRPGAPDPASVECSWLKAC